MLKQTEYEMLCLKYGISPQGLDVQAMVTELRRAGAFTPNELPYKNKVRKHVNNRYIKK